LVHAYRTRIDKLNPAINAVVTFDDRAAHTEVLRDLGAVVDAVAVAGATVDATARPCPLRTAERLAQQLIQAEFAGAYRELEYKRL
jgi:hypothetical protein